MRIGLEVETLNCAVTYLLHTGGESAKLEFSVLIHDLLFLPISTIESTVSYLTCHNSLSWLVHAWVDTSSQIFHA